MILSTQRLPPIKNNIKPNISLISSPKNIFFPNYDKLKKFKKKIAPISNISRIDNSDDINIRINTSASRKSENESKSPESTYKKKIIFFPNSVNKILLKNESFENNKKKYFFKIIKDGNDSTTILKCFEHRINWKNISNNNSNKNNKINFIWAPLYTQIDFNDINGYDSKKINIMCNHFSNQNQISNKLNCFKNLMAYCEEKNIDIFKYVPLTILIQYESTLFLRQIKSFEFIFNNINKFIISDFNQNKELKDWKKKYRNFFYIDNDCDSKIGLKTNLYIFKNHYDGRNLWLLKAMNLNRGLAIKIIDSFEECQNYIKYYYQGGIIKCVKNYNSNNNILNSNNENKSNINLDNDSVDKNKKIYFKLPKIVTTLKN